VPRTVELLSVALMGAFAGGCLFVSTVLVPAWRTTCRNSGTSVRQSTLEDSPTPPAVPCKHL
jgi:hypothetical protein